ncbi:MAG: hypothetical protein KGD73_02585 [Candidatus Lokiarchaeota archaeon]|nr:hypothetical protein [Candidatus Lokiarchaeota archaeon]
MARKARRAPKKPFNPLEVYSTWDLRIAKSIYYGIILASIITILGIWLAIIGWLVESGRIAEMLSLGAGVMALIIIGIVAGHLFLLVLFYTLFRGGILKLCRRLFKDRMLAKKYEDYTTLRLLLAVTLIVVYMFIITLIAIIIPSFFWSFIAGIWLYIITHFNPGEWVLLVGVLMFIIIILIYVGFAIWNHGVYSVLKRVKRIEEEEEIDHEIEIEGLKDADEETLMKTYTKQTGKKAVYRGKETNGYLAWKKKVLG